MAGRALGVLLPVAVAALLVAAAARAADDDKHRKCFRSCGKDCHHHNHNYQNGSSATVATDFFPSGSGDANNVSAVTAECKNGCQEDACFKDLPGISHTQCSMITCLSHPHHSKKKTECLKDCCDKCFKKKSPPSPSPPKPGPSPPGPSPPEPSPPTPEPGPPPPEPGPPSPEPGPPPPEPGPPPPEPGPPSPEPGPPPPGRGPKPPSPKN